MSKRLHLLIPLTLFAAFWGADTLAGGTIAVPWKFYQLLDREALTRSPVDSLVLLHSQPPGLNASLAVLLSVSEATGTTVEVWCRALFAVLGAVGLTAVFWITSALTKSRVAAAVACALVLLDPGLHVFHASYFYPFVLQALLAALLASSIAYARHGRVVWLLSSIVLLGAIANLKSLFHPVWTVAYYAALVGVAARCRGAGPPVPKSRHVALVGLLLLLVSAWPLKNAVVFDLFSMTSWTGYHLSRGTPVRSAELREFMGAGATTLETSAALARLADSGWVDDTAVVADPVKSNGARNWNHLMFVATTEDLSSRARAWLLAHPGWWLERGLRQYLCWSRGTFVHPYTGEPTPAYRSTPYRVWVDAYRGVFFADVRPALESVGLVARDSFQLRDRPLPVTSFALLWFPMLLVGTATLAVLGWRRRDELAVPWILALLVIVWVLAIPCATDGVEGNRMRFSCSFLNPVLALALSCAAWRRLRNRSA